MEKRWFLAEGDKITYLKDLPEGTFRVVPHLDSQTWEEIHLLASPEPDGSQEVQESYELHSRSVDEVCKERGITL